jgi:hypothetical protein
VDALFGSRLGREGVSRYVLALDQGTTSSRALLFDVPDGGVAAVDQHEFPQHFPKPGWVEHDPAEIWDSQLRAARGVLGEGGSAASDDRRDRHHQPARDRVVWDRRSGEPVHRAIVWQSRQTAPICDRAARGGARAGGPRPHRARDRRLLLGDQDPLHARRRARRPGPRRARRARLRHGRLVAACTSSRGPRPRDRPVERVAHDALRHPRARLGRRCCSRAAHPARDAAAGGDSSGVVAETDPEWFGGRSRSPASPATSRPRCSARAASPRAAPRTPTAPAASC